MRCVLRALFFAFAIVGSAFADYVLRAPQTGDIYVSPTGSDINSGLTTLLPRAGNPVTTTTLNLLSAGKSLWFLDAGTYSLPASMPNIGGSSESDRIQVAGYPGTDKSAVLSAPAKIYLYGTSFNYWTFQNFTATYVTSLFVVGHDSGNNGINAGHINIVDIVGTQTGLTGLDNAGMVEAYYSYNSVAGADYLAVIKNKQTGSGASADSNASAFIFFRLRHLKVLGNFVTNTRNGIYYKHNHDETSAGAVDIEIAYNMVDTPFRWDAFHVNFASIHDNVFKGGYSDYGDNDGVQGGDNNTINHNTFYNYSIALDYVTNGISQGCLSNTITNNVFAGASQLADNQFGANGNFNQGTTADYNTYTTSSSSHSRNNTTYSLSNYIAAYNGVNAGIEANSRAGTISFINGTPSINTPADWALAGGSAGKAQAITGTDTGVNAVQLLTDGSAGGIAGSMALTDARNDAFSAAANVAILASAVLTVTPVDAFTATAGVGITAALDLAEVANDAFHATEASVAVDTSGHTAKSVLRATGHGTSRH